MRENIKIVDLRQTPNYSKYIKLLGWESKNISGNYLYIKNIPLLGAYIKLQRPKSNIPAAKLMKLAKSQRAFNVLIESTTLGQRDYYLKQMFKEYNKPSLPSKTIIVDLSGSQENMLQNMHHKTRYNIKLAKKRGVRVSESSDIDLFSKLWHEAARRRRLYLSLNKEIKSIRQAFKNNSLILFAKKDNIVLASLLIVCTKTTSYYMYAGSTVEGYKNFAPTLVAWEAIVRSKNLGLKWFDFEGIFDSRYPLKTWKGFSRFKKSFGGEEIEFPGPLIYRRLPI
jgi:lipid II:glycine glycyltransferase (peptidoglycan interpeptide bridge formation enzyme)